MQRSSRPTKASAGSCHALQVLVDESLRSDGVQHSVLRRLAAGEVPEPEAALRVYAREYAGYSTWFPRYLRAVIARLSSEEHRRRLGHNLSEEQGHLDDDDALALRRAGVEPVDVVGVPHPELFARFCHALGLTDVELAQPTAAARSWRERFEVYLQTATEAEAVGALGLGTEHVVKPIYEQLLAGIRRCGALRREDYVFFELHCLVDDQHQQDLLDIAQDLAAAPGGIDGLARGMRTALRLRCAFWDHLEARIDGAHEQHA